MARHVSALLIVVCGISASGAFAQGTRRQGVPAQPVALHASAAGGRISGVVRDDAGKALGGVSIIAMGTTLASVRSDGAGRFRLSLPAGEYILRAAREGYVSTFREPVRVQASVPIERNITLLRQGGGADVVLASLVTPARQAGPPGSAPDDHGHSEMAWRLRNLPRTVLRDASPAGAPPEADASAGEFRPRTSVFDWAVAGSARAATSFFTDTDFRGQVNFITTSSLALTGRRPDDWSRGVAYAALGAPVGARGDWMVRGSLATGDVSSWALVWEYDGRDQETHRVHAGVSYSTQGVMTASSVSMGSATLGSRSVGSVYGADRWRLHRGVEVQYGLRLDRFDYVSTPSLLSPRLGARIAVAPRTVLVASTSRRMVAPGANEFLPPSSAGTWLPPERTFSSLVFGMPLEVGRVRHVEAGLDYQLDSRGVRTIGVRRFVQSVTNQVSTLFGLDDGGGVGHYYVATSGDAQVDGWRVGLAGAFGTWASGSIDYTLADATWADDMTRRRALRRAAPSAARRGHERLHDLTTSVTATLPSTSTHLKVAYRIDTAFSATGRSVRAPILDGRFDAEVRQPLPYQPFGGGRLEVLFSVRSLLRDLDQAGSVYDELLTVAPPLRFTGGVQVRF